MPPCLIAPPESESLGRAIAQAANWEWAEVEERRFAGGEFTLRPLVAVGNRDVCVVQTLAPTAAAPIADRLVRLLFLLAALRCRCAFADSSHPLSCLCAPGTTHRNV